MLQEVKATFRSALDRMDEYPKFNFSISSAAFHEFLQRIDLQNDLSDQSP